MVRGNVFVAKHVECVGAFNALHRRIVGIGTNALAEAAELIAVRCAPGGAKARVAAQYTVFERLPRFDIKDGEG